MKFSMLVLALALAGCGGGGGGSAGGFMPMAAPAAEAKAPEAQAAPAQTGPLNPGCVQAAANHLDCDLVSNPKPIGVGVAPGVFVTFTNRTGKPLQITEVSATTGEQAHWSEYCLHIDAFMTGQSKPGAGEVGCVAKNPGEDYPLMKWSQGLAVPAGAVVYLNSHTEPAQENHTYSLTVKDGSGTQSWRQPQVDAVIECDGQQQSTAWTPWVNTSSKDVYLTGAQIYSQSGNAASNTMSGPACIYVLTAEGAQKYVNCDNALRTVGDVSFPSVAISPGESVAAQARNACAAPRVWDWAAFLHITGA